MVYMVKRSHVFVLFMSLSWVNVGWSTQPITQLPANTSISFKRFCSCNFITNTTSSSFMIPHRTQPELTSFLNNLPPGVSSGSCPVGEIESDASISFPDVFSSTCHAFSTESLVELGPHESSQKLIFTFSNSSLCSSDCQCSYRQNSDSWISFSDATVRIDVCSNDRIQFQFICTQGLFTSDVRISVNDPDEKNDGPVAFSINILAPSACY